MLRCDSYRFEMSRMFVLFKQLWQNLSSFQSSNDPLYKKLWQDTIQYSENRVFRGTSPNVHAAGIDRVLREKYVYMGTYSGVAYYVFQGIPPLTMFLWNFKIRENVSFIDMYS